MHRYHVQTVDTNEPGGKDFSYLTDSIFNVPQLHIAEIAPNATEIRSCRHGEVLIMGDTRRWFLEAVSYTNQCERFNVAILVTAD